MSMLDQFKDTYFTECAELLADMEARLMTLDSGNADLEEINAIFRCAHSIKGGGGAFGLKRLVDFTHRLEFLLDAMRDGTVIPTQEIVDVLLQSADMVARFVEQEKGGERVPDGEENGLAKSLDSFATHGDRSKSSSSIPTLLPERKKPAHKGTFHIQLTPHANLFATGNEPLLLLRELRSLGEAVVTAQCERLPSLEVMDTEQAYLSWHIALTTDKGLDAIREVFEFVEDNCDLTITEQAARDWSVNDEFGGLFDDNFTPTISTAEKSNVVALDKSSATTSAKPGSIASIRVDIDKVDRLVTMVGELVIVQAMIVEQIKDLPAERFQGLINSVEELSHQMRDMQESVMAVRMQPIKSVFTRMPRIVRDLARKLGKDIRLEMEGENTEIDKTVIEQLGDPLTHMIRNSVDHGLEMPEDRKAKGKPEQGVIRLAADQSGGRIIIEISDDGNGINRERVLKKAIEKGLIEANATPTPEEIDHMIFLAGFSTAEQVTDVSGRGVGMDVVRRNISELGGAIELINNPGQGSRFIVSLPLTLAILDGMIIGVGGEMYIIPISNIIETISPKHDEIVRVADGGMVLNVRGDFLPIIHLRDIFRTPSKKKDENPRTLVVLVECGKDRYGMVVDELLGQQQVVIKNITENAEAITGVSGATILGDGKVAFILDIATIRTMQHRLITAVQAA